MNQQTKPKTIYLKDFFLYKKRNYWYIIPSIIYYYNKREFLETGVYTPSWAITLRWLNFVMGIQIQQAYEIKE